MCIHQKVIIPFSSSATGNGVVVSLGSCARAYACCDITGEHHAAAVTSGGYSAAQVIKHVGGVRGLSLADTDHRVAAPTFSARLSESLNGFREGLTVKKIYADKLQELGGVLSDAGRLLLDVRAHGLPQNRLVYPRILDKTGIESSLDARPHKAVSCPAKKGNNSITPRALNPSADLDLLYAGKNNSAATQSILVMLAASVGLIRPIVLPTRMGPDCQETDWPLLTVG